MSALPGSIGATPECAAANRTHRKTDGSAFQNSRTFREQQPFPGHSTRHPGGRRDPVFPAQPRWTPDLRFAPSGVTVSTGSTPRSVKGRTPSSTTTRHPGGRRDPVVPAQAHWSPYLRVAASGETVVEGSAPGRARGAHPPRQQPVIPTDAGIQSSWHTSTGLRISASLRPE